MPATSDPRIRTLGLRTDLEVERDRAIITEHEGFIAVRTPSDPSYHFGNYLIFDEPPRTGDDERWMEIFDEVFADDRDVFHCAFAWSGEDEGEAGGFIARGFTMQDRAVLASSQVREFAIPQGLHVRRLHGEDDWKAQFELSMQTREDVYEELGYARFKAGQIAYHRKISERFGAWLGMFDGDRLVGSCGIFRAGEGVARYQDVGVIPAYRNRGIARSLVSAAGRFALETFGAKQVVIVAIADDFPRGIYEHCGFTLYQRERALWIAHRK